MRLSYNREKITCRLLELIQVYQTQLRVTTALIGREEDLTFLT